MLDVWEPPPGHSFAAPIQPQLDDVGAAWTGGSGGVAVLDDATGATRGNYQAMEGASNAVLDMPVTISDDTEAVVSGMPIQAVPDDFKWSETMDALNRQYLEHRRGSNWRGTLAYTDAIEGMRNDLTTAFVDLGGNLDDVPSRDHHDLRRAIQGLLDQAIQTDDAGQVERVSDFLTSFDEKTYNIFADLGERADEFESAAQGTLQPLDRHIDQAKLLDWLQSQQEDAMRRVMDTSDPAASQAASHEATYFQQMVTALEEGRNPLAESSDQIAYLRETEPAQARI